MAFHLPCEDLRSEVAGKQNHKGVDLKQLGVFDSITQVFEIRARFAVWSRLQLAQENSLVESCETRNFPSRSRSFNLFVAHSVLMLHTRAGNTQLL